MNQNWKGSKPQKSLPASTPSLEASNLTSFTFMHIKSMFMYSFSS